MTEETLKRWANDELGQDEARDVYRWMVRCTSPELSELLTGLLRERREREADAVLTTRGPTWTSLVSRWAELLAEGAAQWTEPGRAPVPASVSSSEPAPQVWLDPRDGEMVLIVDAEMEDDVTVFLTDDDGGALRLGAPSGMPRAWVLPAMGTRPTVWVVWRAAPVGAPPDAAAQLAQLASDDDVDIVALRWTDGH